MGKRDGTELDWLWSSTATVQGDRFETFARWWLLNAADITATIGFQTVMPLADWDNNPFHGDVGVDLVGVDRDGSLWAIQAKGYHPDETIGKDPVANLAGVAPLTSQGGPFTGRIVITTAADFSRNARTVAELNDVLLIDGGQLATIGQLPSSYDELLTWLSDGTPPVAPVTRRAHQDAAINAVATGFSTSDAGQLIMACGTGKTLTALWVQEMLAARGDLPADALTVALFPSISLLEQTLREWSTHRSSDWSALAICSDATVTDSVDPADSRRVELGLPATTDPDMVSAFMARPGARIMFCTYQSSHVIADAARTSGRTIDLVVCDEAHRLAGDPSKSTAVVLDRDAFPAARRLFMTATPRVLSSAGKSAARDADAVVHSMDDHTVFGPVFHTYSFAAAISDGMLTDYEVVVALTTDVEARNMIASGQFIGVDDTTVTARDLAAVIATAKAAQQHGLSRMISFHSRVRRAHGFADLLTRLSGRVDGMPASVVAHPVDGSMSAKVRRQRLTGLANGGADLHLLSNAQCLSEGVDVPSLDGVAFVDRRASEVDIVQAVGRAIRRSEGKTLGRIVIPIVCDTLDDVEKRLDKEGHAKLRQVLWALRSHDEEFALEMDLLAAGRTLPDSNGLPVRDLPVKLRVEFNDDQLQEFADQIHTEVLNAGSPNANWHTSYWQTVDFYTATGRWPSCASDDADELRLGQWVHTQRAQGLRKTRGQSTWMSDDRFATLDATDGWQWDAKDARWEARYLEAVAYYDMHGMWPSHAAPEESVRLLGKWITSQRADGRKLAEGKKSFMTQARYDRLNETVGWVWSPKDALWAETLNHVVQYHVEHGAWPSSVASDPAVKSLGQWVAKQRLFARKAGTGVQTALTPERCATLDAIPGWMWSAQPEPSPST